jgi:23S rRNA (uracil1939-C5)-methyltransferase
VIGRDGKVVFIKGAIPGELVEVALEDKKKDYCLASVKNVVEPSPFRRQPPCRVFGVCGGCQLQFVEYERQVSLKEEIILDTLRRIGGIDVQLMPSLTEREFRYRHRVQFKISQKGEIGFFREGTREVIAVDECPVAVDEINRVLHGLKTLDLKGVREIHVIAGDTVAALIKGNISEDFAQRLLDTGIAGIAFEAGDSLGKDYITLDLNGLKYTITPWSFFQSHWHLNIKVVETVIKKLALLEEKRILDLYAGAGNFSLPLSEGAKEVVAVEDNQYAIDDARRNASLNGIKNCRFIQASVEKLFEAKKKQTVHALFGDAGYDIIVVDPPRPGLPSDCLRTILEAESEKIVYVSCNPATFARDMKKMKEKYEMESIQLIDFFPNTFHIESLAVLCLK